MQNPRELKRRIGTIRNIERTVDAMQKISAARLARERVRVHTNRPYLDAMLSVVGDIAATVDVTHPLLDVREGSGYLLLCIGSDRGMCGAYNTSVMRTASEFIATRHRERLFLMTAGRKLRRFSPRTKATIIREITHFTNPPALPTSTVSPLPSPTPFSTRTRCAPTWSTPSSGRPPPTDRSCGDSCR